MIEKIKKGLVRNIVDPTEGLTVNDPITLQDINLPEPIIVPPLQLPLDPNNVVDEIMYLREIHKKLFLTCLNLKRWL